MMASGDLAVIKPNFPPLFSQSQRIYILEHHFQVWKVSADDLNEIYGESRANGLGHEVQCSQLSIYYDHAPLVYSSVVFSISMDNVIAT
jgi:hypothetical protein